MAVIDFIERQKAFRPNPQPIQNFKSIVVNVLQQALFTNGFLHAANGKEWQLFGLIDSDNDGISYPKNKHLLIIDETHDLETMLLSSDDQLLSHIPNCHISDEQYKIALFISYQVAIIKAAINDFDPTQSILSSANRSDDYRIDILKIPKKLQKTVLQSKQIKKHFSSNGLFKTEFKDFSPNSIAGFWKMINGHHVLQTLTVLNHEAHDQFGKNDAQVVNRAFEMALIDNYNLSNFSKTKLYRDAKEVELLSE